MKERPILFSAPMVRAILSGRKTQTRRLMKPQPHAGIRNSVFCRSGIEDGHGREMRWPYSIGDRLWVRESFSGARAYETNGYPLKQWGNKIWYWADGNLRSGDWTRPRPSIHMPRHLSRITLEITDIRVERLQEISDADAMAEGAAFTCPQCGNDLDDEHGAEVHAACDDPDMGSHGEGFRRIWTAINGSGSWDANPWVWVIEFRGVDS